MGAGESVDMEKYSVEWFRAEFPEHIERYTFEQWFDFFREQGNKVGTDLPAIARAAREAVRVFGTPKYGALSGENEFGPVSP